MASEVPLDNYKGPYAKRTLTSLTRSQSLRHDEGCGGWWEGRRKSRVAPRFSFLLFLIQCVLGTSLDVTDARLQTEVLFFFILMLL